MNTAPAARLQPSSLLPNASDAAPTEPAEGLRDIATRLSEMSEVLRGLQREAKVIDRLAGPMQTRMNTGSGLYVNTGSGLYAHEHVNTGSGLYVNTESGL